MELVEKLKELDFYDVTLPRDGEDMIQFIFERIFTAYGFSVRADQVEVSKQMYHAMMHRKISMSDIPVGLGKTHAYLIAAIVYNLTNKRNLFERRAYHQSTLFGFQVPMPIVITTSSIALQKAIENEYIPSISRMLLENGVINEPITSVQRKGKENYICDQRLKNYVNTVNRDRKPEQEIKILEKLQQGIKIDLTDIKGITNYDKRKINVESDQCYSCHLSGKCRFQKFMQEAINNLLTFQICNHNYYIADILRRKKGSKPLLPNYKAVIIDEAHKLASAAEDMYGISVSKKELIELIQKAKPHNINSTMNQSLIVTAKEAIRLVEVSFSELREQIPKNLFDEPIEKYNVRLTSAIKNELNRLRLNLIRLAELQQTQKGAIISNLKRIAEEIEKMIADNSVSWMEYPNGNEEARLFSVTKQLATHIGQDIFDKDLPFILTSGTIAVHEDFSYCKKGLGLDRKHEARINELTKTSPYDYFNNTLLYQAPNIPYPDVEDEKYILAIGIEIENLIRASHGHALVLFTSYTPMRKIYQLLKEKSFDFPVFQLLKGKSQSIRDYRESKNGVLLACGSLWEGFDFKGDLLSHLIIVKLPFLVPDPITEEHQNQFNSFDGFKKKILIPRMLIRLKQGYGRAIRSEEDTAVISILDPRAKDNYKNVVRNALPKSRVTQDINDIKTFIRAKKQPDYFT